MVQEEIQKVSSYLETSEKEKAALEEAISQAQASVGSSTRHYYAYDGCS